MEVIITKILIIFGLLFTTLFAALLPLLCLKLSTRHKRRQRRRNLSDGEQTFFDKLCCWRQNPSHLSSGNHDHKIALDTGSIRTTASQRKRIKSRSKMILSMLNCFAGGIFLGTSFNGLLPEIRESFEHFDIRWPDLSSGSVTDNNSSGNTTHGSQSKQDPMPIAEIIVVCGLFFILCVEQAAHSWNHWRLKRKALLHAEAERIKMTDLSDARMERGSSAELHLSSTSNESSDSLNKPHHDHSGIRSLMLVATLSLHSLLEGVAIGLNDSLRSVVAIFVAVLFHKCLMAFSMGTNLVQTKQTQKKIIAAALIFALASPLGIAIGLGIKSAGGDSRGTILVNSVLQAIATGTFLYITFFEVLVKEFDSHGHRLAKVLSLFVGYGAVLGSFFADHGYKSG